MTVNGKEISAAAVQRKFYFALNKPKGFICRCGRPVCKFCMRWLLPLACFSCRASQGCMCKCLRVTNRPAHVCCRSNVGLHEDGGEGRLVVSLFDEWIARWQQRQAAKARAGGGGGKPVAPRLFTVGRLDVQSVGLIFVTNDGDWAHRCGGCRHRVAGRVLVGQRPAEGLHCRVTIFACGRAAILALNCTAPGAPPASISRFPQTLNNTAYCVSAWSSPAG